MPLSQTMGFHDRTKTWDQKVPQQSMLRLRQRALNSTSPAPPKLADHKDKLAMKPVSCRKLVL